MDDLWVDAAGNLIGKMNGPNKSAPAIRLMTHMDEISMIVKKINEDGSLRVNPLGGSYLASFGQSPLDILGDHKTVSGILSFGSIHTTKESSNTNKIMPKKFRGEECAPFWDTVHVTTRKTIEELKKAGVHPGTRVVMERARRTLYPFQDCIAGYFLDNRAAIAIDVGPAAKEYQTVLSPDPIIVYQDSVSLYDKRISDHLVALGKKLKFNPQHAVFETYASDASIAHSRGQCAKAALICFPVENTHGYEITHKESLYHSQEINSHLSYVKGPKIDDRKWHCIALYYATFDRRFIGSFHVA